MKIIITIDVEDDNEAKATLEELAIMFENGDAFDSASIYHPVTHRVCGGYTVEG